MEDVMSYAIAFIAGQGEDSQETEFHLDSGASWHLTWSKSDMAKSRRRTWPSPDEEYRNEDYVRDMRHPTMIGVFRRISWDITRTRGKLVIVLLIFCQNFKWAG